MSSLSLSWLERDKDTDLNLFIEGKQRNGKNDQEAGVLFFIIIIFIFSLFFGMCMCHRIGKSVLCIRVCIIEETARQKDGSR
tara:strand:- start:312 stop:557 length:246 start_codon:yes stop_codon:yes gene_type:complete